MKMMRVLLRSVVFLLVAAVAFSGIANAAIVLVATRAGITQTDFIDWSAIMTQMGTSSPSNLLGPAAPLGSVQTSGNVGFGFSQKHFGGDFNTMHFETFGGLTGTALAGENANTGFIDLIFSSPFQALGFDFQGDDGFGSTYTATLDVFGAGGVSLGAPLTVFSALPSQVFIGVQSTSNNIFEIHVHTSGSVPFALDGVTLNSPQAPAGVPEPGTLGLLFLGGAALVGYARKRAA